MLGEILGASAIAIIVVKEAFSFAKNRSQNGQVSQALQQQTVILTQHSEILKEIRDLERENARSLNDMSKCIAVLVATQRKE